MSGFELIEAGYLLPTPAGAFAATRSGLPEPARHLLLELLREPQSRYLDPAASADTGPDADTLGLMHRLGKLGYLAWSAHVEAAPHGALERVLPPLLAEISSTGRALVADRQGLNMLSAGFAHESAEALSALAAELLALYQRQEPLLRHNIGLPYDGWSLCDAAGDGHLGFWPLDLGPVQLVLNVEGLPRFNTQAFRDLVWALARQYG